MIGKRATQRRRLMHKRKPILVMITPGRRSLGEDWSKVAIYANPETGGYDVEREDTPAPADNCAIIVPASGEDAYEKVDFILEYKRKDQEYRKAHNRPIRKGWSKKEIEQMFHDWMELKVRRFKGQTVSGPYGWAQRERP